jgi:hypothetical protein
MTRKFIAMLNSSLYLPVYACQDQQKYKTFLVKASNNIFQTWVGSQPIA